MQGKLYAEFDPNPEPHFIYVIELDDPIPTEADFTTGELTCRDWGYLDIQDFCDDLHAIVETKIWPS